MSTVAAATLLGLVVSAALLFDSPVVVSGAIRERVDVLVSLFTLSLLTLGTAAAALVGVSTYRHDRLSAASALVAVWPLTHPVATVQLTRPSTPTVNVALSSALFLGTPVVLAVGVSRYDLVDYPAGVDTVGERAVFVLDIDGRVVRSNDAARATFGDAASLADVTDCSVEQLASRETVTCWTDTGHRQFDPRVTPLRTDGGATLGHAVTFVDVTTREIRRQRLSVLNRVLRHNVRNQLDVIRAHAEEAGADRPSTASTDLTDSRARSDASNDSSTGRGRATDRDSPSRSG